MNKRLTIRTKVLLIAFSINALCTAAYTVNSYFLQRGEILKGIDAKLRSCAHALPFIVPEGIHDRIDGPEAVSPAQHDSILQDLSRYARACGIIYLYSYMEHETNFVVATTSATDEELEAGTETRFFKVYEQPPPSMIDAWETGEVRYDEYEDEWGLFRSIFVPMTAPGGSRYIVGADVSIGFVRSELRRTLLINIAIGIAIFITVAVVSYLVLNRILRPVQKLTRFTRRMAEQDFQLSPEEQAELSRIAEQYRDEVGQLAEAFRTMERQLLQYIENLKVTTAAKERIESELKIAGGIQQSFLPSMLSPFARESRVDIYAGVQPAKEVAGDLYDFFLVDEDHLCFAIGDVSDKGMPAALFMAVTLTLLRTLGNRRLPPNEILQQLNNALCRNNTSGQFVTLFLGLLNTKTGELACAHGGHNFPYLLKREGAVKAMEPPVGLVVGAMEDMEYELYRVSLEPGDTLFLYTDGITEAENTEGEFYQPDGLVRVLQSIGGNRPAREVVETVEADVHGFAGEARQNDDMTLFAIHLLE